MGSSDNPLDSLAILREGADNPGRPRMRWAILWTVILALILIPFLLFEREVDGLAREWLAEGRPRLGVGAAVAGLLAADVLLPVPSSLVSTAAGALLGVFEGAAASFLGMTAGSLLGYALGRGGRPLGLRLAGESDLARAEALVGRWGGLAIALARPVPVLAEATTIFAGLSRMSFGYFMLFSSLANFPISLAYAAIGALATGGARVGPGG
jgi:uncharacterized membrane protein YdjX (TVP38/TMEM64 family)